MSPQSNWHWARRVRGGWCKCAAAWQVRLGQRLLAFLPQLLPPRLVSIPGSPAGLSPLFSRRLSGATVLKGLPDFPGLWSFCTPAWASTVARLKRTFPEIPSGLGCPQTLKECTGGGSIQKPRREGAIFSLRMEKRPSSLRAFLPQTEGALNKVNLINTLVIMVVHNN